MQVFRHFDSKDLCQHVMNFAYDRWGHLLKTMNQQWLAPVNLQLFVDTIYAIGSPLTTLDHHNNILCLYGDPAYPLRPQLMGPFQGAARIPFKILGTKP